MKGSLYMAHMPETVSVYTDRLKFDGGDLSAIAG
jgi:hypothetical protein